MHWALPDVIDMGTDAINPVQVSSAGMDTARLKREFGADITFWGRSTRAMPCHSARPTRCATRFAAH